MITTFQMAMYSSIIRDHWRGASVPLNSHTHNQGLHSVCQTEKFLIDNVFCEFLIPKCQRNKQTGININILNLSPSLCRAIPTFQIVHDMPN